MDGSDVPSHNCKSIRRVPNLPNALVSGSDGSRKFFAPADVDKLASELSASRQGIVGLEATNIASAVGGTARLHSDEKMQAR